MYTEQRDGRANYVHLECVRETSSHKETSESERYLNDVILRLTTSTLATINLDTTALILVSERITATRHHETD